MSKEEVEKALKEIKEQYAPITIDVTPTEESNKQNRSQARKLILSADENRNQEDQEEPHPD